jgi:hypothetical protein
LILARQDFAVALALAISWHATRLCSRAGLARFEWRGVLVAIDWRGDVLAARAGN